MKITTKIKHLSGDSVVFEIKPWQIDWFKEYKDKEITLTVSDKKDRSGQQNALLWALIHEIDKAMNGYTSKQGEEELYLQLIEEANIKPEFIMALPEVVDRFRKTSSFRVVQEVERREYKGKEMVVLKCFPGSSKFTTDEMSDFIEATKRYASESGINLNEWSELI